jgi:hypothetical protein
MAGQARPTLRCLREDLRQAVPPADTPLYEVMTASRNGAVTQTWVRDSSPWRRTRTELGFYRLRSFLCARFVPMLSIRSGDTGCSDGRNPPWDRYFCYGTQH